MPIGMEEDELSKLIAESEARQQALSEQQGGYDTGGAIAGALASLGAAFQGKDSMAAVNQIHNQRRQARQDQQSALDKWKASKIQELQAKRDATKAQRDEQAYARDEQARLAEEDPNSPESQGWQQVVSRLSPNANTKGMTAKRAKELLPAFKEIAANEIARAKLAAEKAAAGRKSATGENLGIDQKEIIKGLSSKNANKMSIKNQIDAVMSGWDALSDDQKVTAGSQLLKTLNSTEGADAIGAEEAGRLGAKLEFALGNLFDKSKPLQFGRDLEGFKEQATNTSKAIEKAIQANQAQIDAAYGRAPQTTAVAEAPKTITPEMAQAELERRRNAKTQVGKR